MKNKSKKRLIIFMPSIEGGGVEKNLFLIANYLTSKLSNISILTANKNDKIYFNKKIAILAPKGNFWKNQNRVLKTIICLFLLLKEVFKNKEIVIFSFQANIYCIIFSKLFGIKIISRSNSAPSGWSKNIIKRILFRLILPLANETIVNSIQFKRDLDKTFKTNSICIYNPLDIYKVKQLSKKKLYFPFFTKKTLNIINVGRFTDQKDHMTLLRSINVVSKKIPLKLLIIGRGINQTQMENYINSNSLNKIVKILPFQKNPFNYINKSDLFILTSKFEGLPNVLLEAMSLKKFVISSNCPTGPKEILKNGKYGLLFKVGNPNMLSKKIKNFYKNKKKMVKKVNKAYRSLNRFDYNYNLGKYFNLINKYCE